MVGDERPILELVKNGLQKDGHLVTIVVGREKSHGVIIPRSLKKNIFEAFWNY